MTNYLLSARDVRRFLEQFWQKAPLLKRAVLPEIAGTINRKQLMAFACRDDVESRLVLGTGKTWEVRHGPFRQRDFLRLPPRNWTLLVNGVENLVPAARTLQMQCGFVPYARQDDVMVSYAAPGGSVGAHYDSYDVFLFQGQGKRRWKISKQADLQLVEGAPLKILRRFRPQREWVLQHGDLLYLPPNYAHHGVAVDECITWSLGLRAPSHQEMASRFLDFLRDNLKLTGEYRDRELKTQRHPALISIPMLRKVRAILKTICWRNADITCCLGEYLTEPRSNIVFERPRRVSRPQFLRTVASQGIRLNLKTRMLLSGRTIFINGESVFVAGKAWQMLRQLADSRSLPAATQTDAVARELLYQWYRAGYVDIAAG